MTESQALQLLTPEACRAGRALLRWTVADLVQKAGTSPNSIVRLENGGSVRPTTALKIIESFERMGVVVTNGDATGVRLLRGSAWLESVRRVRDRILKAKEEALASPLVGDAGVREEYVRSVEGRLAEIERRIELFVAAERSGIQYVPT